MGMGSGCYVASVARAQSPSCNTILMKFKPVIFTIAGRPEHQ